MNDINPSYPEIKALYERFLDILQQKDFDQLQDLVSADFHYTENGQEMTLQQLIEREKQALKGAPKSTINSHIREITVNHETALIIVDGEFRTEMEVNGTIRVYEGKLVQRIEAIQQGEKWLFRSSNVTATQMTMDGNRVDPETLDAMHRVEKG